MSVESLECDGRKRGGPWTKAGELRRVPEVLLIQLKRFAASGYKVWKTHKCIRLEKSLRREIGSRGSNFELGGTVIHEGATAKSGHYNAFAKAAKSRGGRANNDSVVPITKESEVLKRQPYLLL